MNYNQFGSLNENTIVNYEDSEYTISNLWEEFFDESVNSINHFRDKFSDYEFDEDNEDAIYDMVQFVKYHTGGSYDVSTDVAEAFDFLDDELEAYAEAERAEFKKIELEAIESAKERIQNAVIDEDVRKALYQNLTTKGTAWEAFCDAVDAGDYALADEILYRIDASIKRHVETDYDNIDKTGLSDEQVSQIRKQHNF